jgi:DNA-binding SARP family transcriptional activator
MLSVSLLGDFCIRHDEAPVTDVDTPRLQSLLAYLMLHRDAPQSRAHLAFLFWPDTTEAQARTNLRNLLHHLRRALPHADSYLDASVHTLQWQSDAPFALDVADFDAALSHAEQAPQMSDSAAVREALERAVALYKGDLLPSCYDDWIIPQRERLRQACLSALERLVRLLEEERDYEAAIRYARRLLRHDPLHEATYRRLIRLHALDGDRASALRVYHTCTTILQRELDVEPSAATRAAYEQLLGPESRPAPAVPTMAAFPPLVGREREWTQMLQAWHAVAAGGEPHVVMLRGEAGIGKSRLAEELLQWAVRQGITSSNARCYAAEGELAYAPVTAWLRAQPLAPLEDVWLAEVGRLLPEVLVRRPDLPQPVALTEAWQRERLFEALSRAILGTNQPLLLMIDDLQWCDRDTLEWLHFLLRFDCQARLVVVGTYRPEEIGEGHPLGSSLQALRLEGRVTELDLGPLDEAATHSLATQVAGMAIDIGTAQLLYRETEGNPLFVVETVRAGLPAHDQKLNAGMVRKLPHDSLPGDVGLPPKVRSVLEARLAQLSPPARELAGLAATIGRDFSLELLAKASDCDEDTLVGELDELWQRRIVRQHGADTYDFSHDKLREVAYGGMSTARRRLLHRHAAQALEALHAAEPDPVSYQVAAHYEHAGLPEQAVPYYLRAADVARQVYANEEAIALLQRGLTLVEDRGAGGGGGEHYHEVPASLYEALGDVLAQIGRRDGAREAYRQAMAGAPGDDLVWRARLKRRIGTAWDEENRWQEAMQAYTAAEAALGPEPPSPAPEWWREWLEIQHRRVWLYYGLGHLDEMSVLAERCRPVVERYATPLQRGEFFQGLSLWGFRKERYALSDETLAHARASVDAFRESGDANALTLAVSGLGFALLWAGHLDEAEQTMLVGLEQAERSGDVAVQARVLTYLTVLYRMRGHVEQVRHFAARSLALATARQMFEYIGMAKAGLTWLAWQEGNEPMAEAYGEAAVEMWQQAPLSTPFQWTARWPLLAVGLAQNRLADAMGHAQAVLQPEQQRLPSPLTMQLEQAVAAWQQGDSAAAGAHLRQALELARKLGFL